MEFEIMPHELKERLDKKEDVFLLDVREPEEFEIAKISENLIPLSQLESRANELDRAKYTVVFCHHGIRSAQAVQYLMGLGFNKIQNLSGGIDQWSLQVDSSVPRY